jgi:hypothetical protein
MVWARLGRDEERRNPIGVKGSAQPATPRQQVPAGGWRNAEDLGGAEGFDMAR